MEGLLRYGWRRWWVLLAGVVLGGALGFLLTVLHQDAYVAQSLVVLTDSQIPTSQFADVARSVFPTDTVLSPVISGLGIKDETPGSLIASGALSVTPAPGGQAVQIVAKTQIPDLTLQLANAAAASFAKVGESTGLGTFAQFPSEGPARKQTDPVTKYVVAGAAFGSVVAALALALLYLTKRGLAKTRDPLRADATFRVRVEVGELVGEEGVAHPIGFTPEHALPALLRGIAAEAGGGEVIGVVLDDGRDLWAPLAVAEQLALLAEKNVNGNGNDGREAVPFRWWRSTEPMPRTTATCVAVIASEHAPVVRLQDVERQLEAAGDPFVVLVRVSAADVAS